MSVKHRQGNPVAREKRPQLGVGEHRVNTLHPARRRRIDSVQSRMCGRASEKRGVQQAFDLDVVDEAALTAQQRRILDASHAATGKRRMPGNHDDGH